MQIILLFSLMTVGVFNVRMNSLMRENYDTETGLTGSQWDGVAVIHQVN